MKAFSFRVVVIALGVAHAAGAVAGLRGARAAAAGETAGTGPAAEAGAGSQIFVQIRHVASRMVGRVTGRQQPGQPSPVEQTGEFGSVNYFIRILIQLLFALIYYYLIVLKYPSIEAYVDLKGPLDAPVTVPADAKEMQDMNAIEATCHPNMSFPNAGLAFACSGPRAAHTFHSVGLLNYWAGCILMTCCPCCTLFYTNACTTLNMRLGGEKQNCFMSCLCAFCCSCCLIAQDAQTLDLVTGTKTGFFYTAKPE